MDAEAVGSLHRYWIYANRLRLEFLSALTNSAPETLNLPPEQAVVTAIAGDVGVFMSCWYGTLYAVVEGYRELEFHDPEIDELLKSDNLDLLRRFRNGTFHFQKQWFSIKMVSFIESKTSVPWVSELHAKLGSFLLSQVEARLSKHPS